MDGAVVPATVALDGQPVTIQIQVSEQAVTDSEDPERDVSILGTTFSFDDVESSIGALAGAVTKAVARAAPDEAEVEFGVDIGVEAGKLTSLLVKGSGSATLKVRLLWKHDGKAQP
jgi:hypothetical protein